MWFLKLNRIANCDVSVLRSPPNYHTDLYGARRSVNNAKESGFHNPRTEKMGQTRGQLASSFSAWDHDRALERLPCGNRARGGQNPSALVFSALWLAAPSYRT